MERHVLVRMTMKTINDGDGGLPPVAVPPMLFDMQLEEL